MGMAFNPYFTVDIVDLTDDTSVAATTGENNQDLTPPVGKIYEIFNIYYNAPAPVGDTSGTHSLHIQLHNGTTYTNIGEVTGNHSTTIQIQQAGMVGDSLERPAAAGEQQRLINLGILKASNSHPVRFNYDNDTDANQTGTRTLYVWVKVYNEL